MIGASGATRPDTNTVSIAVINIVKCIIAVEIHHAVLGDASQEDKRVRIDVAEQEKELGAATEVLRKLQMEEGLQPLEEELRNAVGEADVGATVAMARKLAQKKRKDDVASPYLPGYFMKGELNYDVEDDPPTIALNTRSKKRIRNIDEVCIK